MNIYKAKKHSDAVKLMTDFYVGLLGYKLSIPNVEGGVFAIASEESGLIITLLDDKTIKITDGQQKELGFIDENEAKTARDGYIESISMVSKDE